MGREWDKANPDKKKEATKRWQARNPNYGKEYYRKNRGKIYKRTRSRSIYKNYGISYEEYYSKLDSQNGKCACCGRSFKNGSDAHLHHCHSRGVVMDFLCQACNVSEGKMETSDNVMKLFIYMKKYEQN